MALDRTWHARRRFLRGSLTLAGLGLLSGCQVPRLPWQAAKPASLGFLGSTAPQPFYDALRQGLAELGYAEGRDIAIEYRYAEGNAGRLPGLAAELTRLPVEVIVTAGTPATQAAKDASSTIPIVMGSTTDPVGAGFVASLARPGGNVTGMSTLAPATSGKRLELLKETLPGASRLAVLINAANQGALPQLIETEQAARGAGLRLQLLEVGPGGDLAGAFEAAAREQAEVLLVMDDPVFTARRTELVELAARRRLPAIYANAEVAIAGGLMAYGTDFADLYRRAATFVDKILKGARPADLPIEQPTKFSFVVNVKTAQALGLTIPPSILQQATQILQ